MKKKYSIAASLEYGRYFSKAWIIYFYIFAFFGLVVIGGIVFISIVESMYEMLLCLILPLLSIPVAVYVIFYYHKLSAQIKLWLQDVVELNAKSVEIGTYKYDVAMSRVNKQKIQVSFVYNGNKVTMYSGMPGYEKTYAHNTKAGYEGIFRKFANKYIKILYSPKYNQVLILNDKIKQS